ncbi:hypothetical protein RB195_001398 [Necator americanus]|uniref:lipoyl(octanoyl) transferase n=1 Tax=Necator americanus TaxID=51031 RepID=A0ABR1DEB4_NECAM
MKNAHCEDGGVQLEGSQIVETPSYVYLGRSVNMENNLKEELNRRMRAAWAAFAAVREATDQLTDQDVRAHLFDSTVLPALCYAAETWADTAATSRKLLTTHRALERCLLKFNRCTQHLTGLRSSELRGMSRLRYPVEYISKAKHRWAGHIMRRIDDRWTKRTLEWIPRDAKRPRGRPPTRWGDAFATRMDQLRAQLDTAQGPRQRHSRNLRTPCMTMARDRNEWKRCWGCTSGEGGPYKYLIFSRTSRGGLITFHGLGQLVIYPIFELKRVAARPIGVRRYVEMLEQVIIDCATDDFNIPNVGRTKHTGVWVRPDRKLAALGIAVSHGVSYHGLALNCNTDLTWFEHVVGCGIEGVEATSLSRECQRDVSIHETLPKIVAQFSRTFGCEVIL